MASLNRKEVDKLLALAAEIDKDRVSVDDFADVAKALVTFAQDTRILTEREVARIKNLAEEIRSSAINAQTNGVDSIKASVEKRLNAAVAKVEGLIERSIQRMQKEQESALNYLYDKVSALRSGRDGEPGKDAPPVDEKALASRVSGEVLQKVQKESKDFEKKVQDEIQNIRSVRMVGGARGIQLFVDGSKQGLVNSLNLVAGSNVTLSYNRASGRQDITISATGGGSGAFSVIAVSGTINDTNTSFTAASTPVLVVVNGNAYRHGAGVTISGTSITLDNPVGAGGDVYALG
jgi:hypothetical protein